jgi:hypothetical protein
MTSTALFPPILQTPNASITRIVRAIFMPLSAVSAKISSRMIIDS